MIILLVKGYNALLSSEIIMSSTFNIFEKTYHHFIHFIHYNAKYQVSVGGTSNYYC